VLIGIGEVVPAREGLRLQIRGQSNDQLRIGEVVPAREGLRQLRVVKDTQYKM